MAKGGDGVTRRAFLKGTAGGALALTAGSAILRAGDAAAQQGEEGRGAMKILAINGSPRKGHSNTQRLSPGIQPGDLIQHRGVTTEQQQHHHDPQPPPAPTEA